MFYSKINKRPSIEYREDLSRETEPIYQLITDKLTGKKELVKTGERNIYEFIQEQKEYTDIATILKKAELGDLTALNKKIPLWGDFTQYPTSLAERQNTINKLEIEFAKLPAAIKNEYNNSASEFIADWGSNKMKKLFNPEPEKERGEEQTEI